MHMRGCACVYACVRCVVGRSVWASPKGLAIAAATCAHAHGTWHMADERIHVHVRRRMPTSRMPETMHMHMHLSHARDDAHAQHVMRMPTSRMPETMQMMQKKRAGVQNDSIGTSTSASTR